MRTKPLSPWETAEVVCGKNPRATGDHSPKALMSSAENTIPLPLPSRPTRSALRVILPLLVLTVLTLVAYHSSFEVPELFDDETAISGNPSIRQLWPLSEPLDPPAHAGTGGRPFANLTFALNYAWTEDHLWSYHLVNLAIHLAAALTLFGIVRRTLLRSPSWAGAAGAIPDRELQSRTDAAALTAAALWAVHPVATIAVTYLSQRTESLMALFYLQTLYGFVRARDGSSHRWLAWSALSCLFGVATKEVTVTAPVAVLLYDRIFVAGSFRAALAARGRYYLALAGTWIALAVLLHTRLDERLVGFGLGVGAGRYALTESRAIVLYALRAVWPANLVFDYGPEFLNARQAWPFVLMLLIGGGTMCAAFWKRPAAAFCGAWFLLVLLPTSSIVPIVGQPIAENRVYLPLAGACTALAIAGYRLLGRHGIAVALGVGVAFTWLAERRNDLFDAPLELWSDTIAKQPDNPRAYDQHGDALVDVGRPREAIADYEHALELNPDSTQTHSSFGNALLAAGEPAKAIEHYRRAIELAPQLASNHQNLAAALANTGDTTSALSYYQTALKLDPELATTHTNLGLLLLQLGRFAEAEVHLRHALELDSDAPRAGYALCIVLLQLGRAPEALAQLDLFLQEHPDDTDAQNALGVGLMRLGRFDEARHAFEQVLRLTPAHADAKANLERIRILTGAKQ